MTGSAAHRLHWPLISSPPRGPPLPAAMLGQLLLQAWQSAAACDPVLLLEAAAIAYGLYAVVTRLRALGDDDAASVLPPADRKARQQRALARHMLAQAAGGPAVDLSAVDFAHVEAGALATVAGTVTSLAIRVTPSVSTLAALSELPRLTALSICGDGVLSLSMLETLEALPGLQSLDLRASPVVVDTNNSASGACKVMDIFQFQQRRKLASLALPRRCAVKIGQVCALLGSNAHGLLTLTLATTAVAQSLEVR